MKKIVSIILATMLAAGLLAGCGGKGADAGKTNIRFATWDSAEDLDKQQALVDKFNNSQDKIHVTLEAYGDDFDTKIAASMGSKDAPDVMYMWNFPAYYAGLEKLAPYIEKEGAAYKDNFFEALWPYNSIDGEVYGIPVGYTTHVLYYNKDMFDAAGVEYPTSSWTWDDLREASIKITEHYNDPSTRGFVYSIKPDPYDFEMYLWSNNTAYVGKDGTLEGNVNSPAAMQVYSYFQDLQKDGYAVGDEASGTSVVKSGNAAMYINGSWPIASLTEAGVNFGVVEIPAWKAGEKSASILSSSGLSMSVDSKNKDAAWEFIKFWTGEEANLERIEYELPVLKSVVEAQGLRNDAVKSVFYTMLEQSEGRTPTSFIVDDWSALADKLSLAFESMFNPTSFASPEEAIGQVVQ